MLISKNFLTREASYKPSYSWIQWGPLGTALPKVCRQKLKWPAFSNRLGGMRVSPRP